MAALNTPLMGSWWLMDAVYQRRGWDSNSIPTVEKLHELGIDFPEVLEVIQEAKKNV